MERRTTNAVVTGASRGLGLALARELGRRGANVVMVARDAAALAAAAREIPNALPVAADLAVDRDVDRVAAEAHERLGRVDLLVNNAATLGVRALAPALDTPPEAVLDAFRVNVLGPFRLTRALVGPMLLHDAGTVLTISTDAAKTAYPTWGAYGATKAAFDHLIATLAAELEGTGVSFVVADPGEMDTALHHQALPEADPATLRDPAAVAARLLDGLSAQPSGARWEV